MTVRLGLPAEVSAVAAEHSLIQIKHWWSIVPTVQALRGLELSNREYEF
jgi:hypothetical protein